MSHLHEAFFLAQKMGKRMDRGEVLQRQMQEK